jgi:hypothetical protein
MHAPSSVPLKADMLGFGSFSVVVLPDSSPVVGAMVVVDADDDDGGRRSGDCSLALLVSRLAMMSGGFLASRVWVEAWGSRTEYERQPSPLRGVEELLTVPEKAGLMIDKLLN